ncbi:hypothetical protein PQX77_018552 [Marasmius sp. AFHP31]|nr:hypothetical protein PQX77_018552 [Marasmius sp. AFHP31]
MTVLSVFVSHTLGACTAAATNPDGTHQDCAAESLTPKPSSRSTQLKNIMGAVFGAVGELRLSLIPTSPYTSLTIRCLTVFHGIVPIVLLIIYFVYREHVNQRKAVENKRLAARPWSFHWPSARDSGGESSASGPGPSTTSANPSSSIFSPELASESVAPASVREQNASHRVVSASSLRGELSSAVDYTEHPNGPPPPYSRIAIQV